MSAHPYPWRSWRCEPCRHRWPAPDEAEAEVMRGRLRVPPCPRCGPRVRVEVIEAHPRTVRQWLSWRQWMRAIVGTIGRRHVEEATGRPDVVAEQHLHAAREELASLWLAVCETRQGTTPQPGTLRGRARSAALEVVAEEVSALRALAGRRLAALSRRTSAAGAGAPLRAFPPAPPTDDPARLDLAASRHPVTARGGIHGSRSAERPTPENEEAPATGATRAGAWGASTVTIGVADAPTVPRCGRGRNIIRPTSETGGPA